MADPNRGTMIATVRMIGFSGHIEIGRDSVPLIGKALRDELGTMHGPFVGITMMGPGADRSSPGSCWRRAGISMW
jgi:hypothetical protein